MSNSRISRKGRGMLPNYRAKSNSYLKEAYYITKHKEYEELNEWGSHELTALFYEIVLLSKYYLKVKKWNKQKSHQNIIDGLDNRANSKISGDYEALYEYSREIRYELLNIDKQMREDFLDTYKEIKEFFVSSLKLR